MSWNCILHVHCLTWLSAKWFKNCNFYRVRSLSISENHTVIKHSLRAMHLVHFPWNLLLVHAQHLHTPQRKCNFHSWRYGNSWKKDSCALHEHHRTWKVFQGLTKNVTSAGEGSGSSVTKGKTMSEECACWAVLEAFASSPSASPPSSETMQFPTKPIDSESSLASLATVCWLLWQWTAKSGTNGSTIVFSALHF